MTPEKIAAIKRESRPSEVTGEPYCNRCGACCRISPCQFEDISDVRKLAEYMGLPLPYFIGKYCQQEFTIGGILVTPKRKKDESCVFLHENACQVHAARPKGGALFECWSKTNGRGLKPFVWGRKAVKLLAMAAGDPYEKMFIDPGAARPPRLCA